MKSLKYKLESRLINLCLLVTISVVSLSCTSGKSQSKKKPNLLIIHTDEQTFRSISSYNNSWGDLQTPNIDFLSKNGARFERFYANHPVCTPSRATLLTGKYAQSVGSYMNDIPLKEEVITIGDMLKDNDYKTGYSGKLHLVGASYPGIYPERNLGFDDNRYMFNNSHIKKLIINQAGQMESPGGTGDEKTYTTDFLTDRTIEFIDKNKSQDWAYMVSIPDPHDPNKERSPYDTLFKAANMKLPATFQLNDSTNSAWKTNQEAKYLQYHKAGDVSYADFHKEHKAMYYGMVKHIDDCVGRILNYLRKNGLLENTIIVYTTDHGDMMGEFSRYDKNVFYDASAKIPFIVHYPPKIKPNTVVNEVVSNIDFVPTILNLMEIPYKKNAFDGTSFATMLSAKTSNNETHMAFLSFPESVGVVTDKYKLIVQNKKEPWLIDTKNDPNELENAIHKVGNRDAVKLLSIQLKEYLENHADPNWTDSLTHLYDRRSEMHKMFRPPAIQRAKPKEIYWRNELENQLNKLID